MTEPIAYDIELKGNVGSRSLRPLIDDFSIDRSEDGVTRLAGKIQDPSHLHGVVLHLASMNIEIISIVPAHSQDVRHEPQRSRSSPLQLGLD